jgi:hypothetical protein
MTTIKAMLIGMGAALAGVLLFLVGRWTAPEPPIVSEDVKVVTEVVHDTITVERPVVRYVHKTDSIRVVVRDTLSLHDTLYISLPREVKVYEDERYRAEVSGYMPSLDRIDIYQQTQLVEKEVVRNIEVRQRTRWGIGITAGYGVTIGREPTFAPYVGIGITYNIMSW